MNNPVHKPAIWDVEHGYAFVRETWNSEYNNIQEQIFHWCDLKADLIRSRVAPAVTWQYNAVQMMHIVLELRPKWSKGCFEVPWPH